MRAVFPNPPGSQDQPAAPAKGLYARIRLFINEPQLEIQVPERAIVRDQGEKFIYVVGDQNKVQARPVTLVSLLKGWRVIERTRLVPKRDAEGMEVFDKEGKQEFEKIEVIHKEDWVIVNVLQFVRPGMTVDPSKPEEESGSEKEYKPPKKGATMLAKFFIERPVFCRGDFGGDYPGGLLRSPFCPLPSTRKLLRPRSRFPVPIQERAPWWSRTPWPPPLNSRSMGWKTCCTCRRSRPTTAATT